MSRADQYNVTVRVEGLASPNLGTFDKMSGGDAGSEETKYRPGAMGQQVSLGGPQTVDNVTVSRLYRLDRDPAIVAALLPKRGKVEVTVTKQSLTTEGVATTDPPLIYKGKLMRVGFPDADSESNDAALLELEISSASVTK